MDKTSFYIGVLCGIIIGLLLSGTLIAVVMYAIGQGFHVDSVAINLTIPINESRMIDAINQSRIP